MNRSCTESCYIQLTEEKDAPATGPTSKFRCLGIVLWELDASQHGSIKTRLHLIFGTMHAGGQLAELRVVNRAYSVCGLPRFNRGAADAADRSAYMWRLAHLPWGQPLQSVALIMHVLSIYPHRPTFIVGDLSNHHIDKRRYAVAVPCRG